MPVLQEQKTGHGGAALGGGLGVVGLSFTPARRCHLFSQSAVGCEPGRSPHQALDALWRGLMAMGGGWIIDLDIETFFDDVDWVIFGTFWTNGCVENKSVPCFPFTSGKLGGAGRDIDER